MAVDEIFVADGAEFSGGEETGDGDGAEDLAGEGDVVVGHVEEAGAAAVAGDDEGAEGGIGEEGFAFEEEAHFLVGGFGVADVELKGLSGADHVADEDGARFAADADEGADEKIASAVVAFSFIDDAADLESAGGDELAIVDWEL